MDVLLKAAAADADAIADDDFTADVDAIADDDATAARWSRSPHWGADTSSDEETTSAYTYAGKWSFSKRARAQAIDQERRRRERWWRQTRAPDEDERAPDEDESKAKARRCEPDPLRWTRVTTPALEREARDARTRYTSAWGGLAKVSEASSPILLFADIPWPSLEPVHDAEALGRVSSAEVEQIVIPQGTETLSQRRRSLVNELRRWHPDKFTSRWGGSLVPAEAAAVLEGVKQVSQSLNELLATRESSQCSRAM